MILIERENWAINIGPFYISFTYFGRRIGIDAMFGILIVHGDLERKTSLRRVKKWG